jgi:hypothetical protein
VKRIEGFPFKLQVPGVSPPTRLQSGFRPPQGLWKAATGVREGLPMILMEFKFGTLSHLRTRDQLAPGGSAWSIAITSTGTFVPLSCSPSCCCNASKRFGAAVSGSCVMPSAFGSSRVNSNWML